MTPVPRARSSTARFAAVAAIVLALFVSGVAAGAAGSTMIIGSEANNAGSANTQLLTNSSVVAFKLLQNGPGTALMGYATPTSGATRGVYGRVDSPNGDGIQARNAAASLGTGAALHAYGQANIGIIAESSGTVPLKLIAPGGVAPFSTNSSTKVSNLNADLLDGLDYLQFARVDQTQHYTCLGSDMAPISEAFNFAGFGARGLTSGPSGTMLTCSVHLPDGAAVTGFSADVYDNHATYEIWCGLTRFAAGQYTPDDMAVTNGSGDVATPGEDTLTDATIVNGVIDNATYGYAGWCNLTGVGSSNLMFYKVTVTYTGAP